MFPSQRLYLTKTRFYKHLFPIPRLVTIKTLLAIIAINKWHLVQLNFNNAFLNEDLSEEIYMDLPLMYSNLIADATKERVKVLHVLPY